MPDSFRFRAYCSIHDARCPFAGREVGGEYHNAADAIRWAASRQDRAAVSIDVTDDYGYAARVKIDKVRHA